MRSESIQHIHLAQAAATAEACEIVLGNDFFAQLDQNEIVGGELRLSLRVKATAGAIYVLTFCIEGQVTVLCDRCLEPLTIPVITTDTIKVKDDLPDDSDAPDMLYTTPGSTTYDAAWDIYEIVETALPLQRVHPIEECSPEMLSRLLPNDNEDDLSDDQF